MRYRNIDFYEKNNVDTLFSMTVSSIDKDKKEVFELYTQSSSGPKKKKKKGTGIGLHFVKLLCEGLKLEYKIEDSLTLGGAKFILTKRLKEQKNV